MTAMIGLLLGRIAVILKQYNTTRNSLPSQIVMRIKSKRTKGSCFFRSVFFIAFFLLALCQMQGYAEDEVKINILVANPSSADKLNAPVTHYLPPELKPEDIVDKAGMDIHYDQDKQTYYLTTKIALEPKETKTITVRVKNVWNLSEELITKTREETNQYTQALENTDYSESAKLLSDKISDKLNTMEEEKGRVAGVRQRIELYRAHVKELDAIRKEVSSLESMKKLKSGGSEGVRTAKFIITAENPSAETKKMTIRAELPKDITAEDVLDKSDFLLVYDAVQKRYVVEKQDTFQAQEKKKYEITLRDIWYIPQEKLDLITKQTETLLGHFKGSSYENFSKQHGDFIANTLADITLLQTEIAGTAAIEDRIRAYTLNSSRLELANQKLKDLQDLLLEIPMKRTETTIEKIRQAVKNLAHLIDIIKVGFKPDLSTTWWIILGVIAFLFVMAASFYIIWVTKLKDVKKVVKKAEPSKAQAEEAKKESAEAQAGVSQGAK